MIPLLHVMHRVSFPYYINTTNYYVIITQGSIIITYFSPPNLQMIAWVSGG